MTTADGNIKLWFRAVRPFAYSASITPVVLGIALAGDVVVAINWFTAALTVLGGVLLHTGTNLINDYYDDKTGVDKVGTFGGSGVIQEGLLRPRAIRNAGYLCFGLSALIGVYLIAVCGSVIAVLGIAGILLGYLYTGKPGSYKYLALGEVGVFVAMGILMVWGAYYVQVGRLDMIPLLYSVPVGFLVTAILHANNFRDVESDRAVGIKTLPILLGRKVNKKIYTALVLGAYAWVVGMVIFRAAPWTVLVVVMALPTAIPVLKLIRSAPLTGDDEGLAPVDMLSAKHHMAFGVLLLVGILAARFVV
ncbi:MAG: 1,4-dihydroxy-2-naphthoate octaprenyltransferase [Proteobacteria bacterium]|nr:1,4-dihydroxy-2-naphthoate octaprenyltransferase [Pseudomonadota bacterium]